MASPDELVATTVVLTTVSGQVAIEEAVVEVTALASVVAPWPGLQAHFRRLTSASFTVDSVG